MNRFFIQPIHKIFAEPSLWKYFMKKDQWKRGSLLDYFVCTIGISSTLYKLYICNQDIRYPPSAVKDAPVQ